MGLTQSLVAHNLSPEQAHIYRLQQIDQNYNYKLSQIQQDCAGRLANLSQHKQSLIYNSQQQQIREAQSRATLRALSQPAYQQPYQQPYQPPQLSYPAYPSYPPPSETAQSITIPYDLTTTAQHLQPPQSCPAMNPYALTPQPQAPSQQNQPQPQHWTSLIQTPTPYIEKPKEPVPASGQMVGSQACSCYGANSLYNCCDCASVIKAYDARNWKYDEADFHQCRPQDNQSQKTMNAPQPKPVYSSPLPPQHQMQFATMSDPTTTSPMPSNLQMQTPTAPPPLKPSANLAPYVE